MGQRKILEDELKMVKQTVQANGGPLRDESQWRMAVVMEKLTNSGPSLVSENHLSKELLDSHGPVTQ
jgi:hypothetical protein